MTPFGLRKRLKSAVKNALGKEEPAAGWAAPPEPPPPPAPKPPAAAPPRPPTAPPSPSIGAPAAGKAGEDLPGKMWVQAGKAKADEIAPGSAHQVDVFGKRYALFRVGEDFHVTHDACPHAGGPLGDGDLDGNEVTCPFHGWTFNVTNGECTSGSDLNATCVPVKVKNNRVFIEVS